MGYGDGRDCAGLDAGALTGLLAASHGAPFAQLPRLLDIAAKEAGEGGARLFVADLQKEALREVTGIGLSAGKGGEEYAIEGTARSHLSDGSHHGAGPWRGVLGAGAGRC